MRDELTPALLRADAAALRRKSALIEDWERIYDRAAAALEEQAARLEAAEAQRGEPVCLWPYPSPWTHTHNPHTDGPWQTANALPSRCPTCDLRLALDAREASDE